MSSSTFLGGECLPSTHVHLISPPKNVLMLSWGKGCMDQHLLEKNLGVCARVYFRDMKNLNRGEKVCLKEKCLQESIERWEESLETNDPILSSCSFFFFSSLQAWIDGSRFFMPPSNSFRQTERNLSLDKFFEGRQWRLQVPHCSYWYSMWMWIMLSASTDFVQISQHL